jgi:octaprenyl-diphosphate synthase
VNINAITSPIKQELKEFDRHFRSALQSRVGIVDTIARYMVHRKGKRIRPSLVLLTAGSCGGISDSTYRGAALVELMHSATLIHDDVVDDASTRRGVPSINAIWKNKISVLMGDYVLSRGLLLSLQNNDTEFLHIISRAVKRMSEGELHQIQKSRQLDIDEATYFSIIGDKTASLLSTCCEIGAASASANGTLRKAMTDYGENLGIAFQIKDDVLDFLGKEITIGKPVGRDLHEKKITLPLIYAFTQATSRKAREVLRMVKRGVNPRDVLRIVSFVKEYGGIDYALEQAEEYKRRALQNLAELPDSPCRNSLMQLTGFVIERNK